MTLLLREADAHPEGEESLRRYLDSRLGAATLAYTLMPGIGGAFAWEKSIGDHAFGMGYSCGQVSESGIGTWEGQQAISPELLASLSAWRRTLQVSPAAEPAAWDWERFHSRGLELAQCLKQELGGTARVMYCRPPEDPSRLDDEYPFEIVEGERLGSV